MKKATIFTLVLMALFAGGFSPAAAQIAKREFIVLTSGDTLSGKVSLESSKKPKNFWLRYQDGKTERDVQFEEIHSYRMNGQEYIVKTGLHSYYATPSHQVISKGAITFFGQQCNSCNNYVTLHVELEDGRVICVNKKNYYDILLPHMTQSTAFRDAALGKKVKYPFFSNVAFYRVKDLVELYNSGVQVD